MNLHLPDVLERQAERGTPEKAFQMSFQVTRLCASIRSYVKPMGAIPKVLQLAGPVACFSGECKSHVCLVYKDKSPFQPIFLLRQIVILLFCSFFPPSPHPLCCSARALPSGQLEPAMLAAPCQMATGVSLVLNDDQMRRWERDR